MTPLDPIRVGPLDLPNRIVMAPLGRARAHPVTREPTPSVVRYYTQRATAGLIVSEATHVSADSVSRPGTSAVHTDGQVAAWQAVTSAVHAAGGRIFQQLFHLGRKADPARLPLGGLPPAPSAIAAKGEFSTPEGPRPFPVPRALAMDEIPQQIDAFRLAAQNSKRAGFDGVEVHGANGFLIDQFLRDGANKRTDRFGGSIENRARFLIEVVDAVSDVFGADRVGVRLSPHHRGDGTDDSTPVETFGYVTKVLSARRIAYLHLIEPVDTAPAHQLGPALRKAFRGPLIVCGGLHRSSAWQALAEGRSDLVAFGAGFIANPDLVERLRRNAPWNPPDPSTFYSGGDRGYTDYPFLDAALSGE
ncbi:MAG TPA: alkene reductase [Polyangiaceae bacterium]|jgi:N-ethylmaleimide reductase|nr:alkene reductase [Polyangiaceae bacterium]